MNSVNSLKFEFFEIPKNFGKKETRKFANQRNKTENLVNLLAILLFITRNQVVGKSANTQINNSNRVYGLLVFA